MKTDPFEVDVFGDFDFIVADFVSAVAADFLAVEGCERTVDDKSLFINSRANLLEF